MIIQSLKTTNYKKISNQSLVEFNPSLNIITGQNNAAKTSLLKAIHQLFSNGKEEKSLNYLLEDGEVQIEVVFYFSALEWKKLIDSVSTRPDQYLENEKDGWYETLAAHSLKIVKKTSYLNKKISGQQKKFEFLNLDLQTEIKVASKFAVINQVLGWLESMDLISFFNSPIFLDHSNLILGEEKFISENDFQNLSSNYQNQNYYNRIRTRLYYAKKQGQQEFLAVMEELKNLDQIISSDIQNIDVDFNTTTGNFEFIVRENLKVNGTYKDVNYDISDFGQGTQKLISIVANLLLNKPSIVLIDEPEVHMHPDLILKFKEILLKIFPQIQFIMVSHSPTLIENVPPVSIIQAKYEKEEKGVVFYKSESAEQIDEILELIGVSHKPVVVFEGKIDEKYVQKAAKLFGLENLLNQVNIKSVNGSGDLENLWRMKPVFNSLRNKKVLLLFDCETNKAEETDNNTTKSIIPLLEKNPIQRGIENLFSEKTIEKAQLHSAAFIDIKEIKITKRGKPIETIFYEVNPDEKTNLCNYLLENGTKEDFQNFQIIFEKIKTFLAN